MDLPKLLKIAACSYVSFGVRFDDSSQFDDNGILILKISVPESSDMLHADGRQMAGELLAKRVKQSLEEAIDLPVRIRYRIRSGHHWTEAEGYSTYDQAYKYFKDLGW